MQHMLYFQYQGLWDASNLLHILKNSPLTLTVLSYARLLSLSMCFRQPHGQQRW